MNDTIQRMINNYQINNTEDKKNAIKEVMQEIVLCGLSRAGFFEKAAFYGGTALRIFYGLDRFSEDLDFSLKVKEENFSLEDYFPTLIKEVKSYGLNVDIQTKIKNKETNIMSAFLKGGTKEHLLLFYPEIPIEGVSNDELIKIKFEVDINPPAYAKFQHMYRLLPTPYEITLYDESSLFAGKIHALLCRGWKQRIKGRDIYDYIFYLSRNTSVNIKHLEARLIQSNRWEENKVLTIDDVKKMLFLRFEEIDYEAAKADVLPFVKDDLSLKLWTKDFFQQITNQLKGE